MPVGLNRLIRDSNTDHNNTVANWTLPAGTYTLETARREDGALLDAILITNVE